VSSSVSLLVALCALAVIGVEPRWPRDVVLRVVAANKTHGFSGLHLHSITALPMISLSSLGTDRPLGALGSS
jgi:hypothetical protein